MFCYGCSGFLTEGLVDWLSLVFLLPFLCPHLRNEEARVSFADATFLHLGLPNFQKSEK
jgi:hypothetical protein